MKKVIIILLFLGLTGCKIEDGDGTLEDTEQNITETGIDPKQSFMLKVVAGYVQTDDYETPTMYLVDAETKEVYIEQQVEPMDFEQMEAADFENLPEYVEPIYELKELNFEEDVLLLAYATEIVHFTPLSATVYETEEGIRYTVEEAPGIAAYLESEMIFAE